MYRNLRQDEALEESALRNNITHIQRVMMGQNFHLRLELNRYSVMVEEQRRTLYEERLAILKGKIPMNPSEQRVRLFYTDKFWADHLAFASYIRESIHLASLANRSPIDEFHAHIIQAYDQIPVKVNRESANMLARLGGSNDPAKWEKFGLKSPTSTWTYLINAQYTQYLATPSAWGFETVIAYWLRIVWKVTFGRVKVGG